MDSTAGMQHEGGSEKSMWLDTKMCAKEMAAPRVLQKDLEKGKSCNPGQMKVFKITEVKNNIHGRTEVTLQGIQEKLGYLFHTDFFLSLVFNFLFH